MKVRCGIIVIVVALLPMRACAQKQEVEVSGRVVDAAGKPVAGAGVSPFWNTQGNKLVPYQGKTTDAQGRFTLAVDFRLRKQNLMALDKDGKAGGFALLEEKPPDKPVEIKLGPLVHVHGRMLFKEQEKPPPYINLMIYSQSSPLLRCFSKDGAFSFHLPPDDYRIRTYSPGWERIDKTISLKPNALDMDLGTIDVVASILTKHKGKTPPAWHVTDARGVPKDVKLSDYKGKWVLLEFWGYW